MALHLGSRLAHYEIVGLLGAGGMGEVYRAKDTKLRRDVALKILPQQFAVDSDRLARFEQEAILLASLNHPHIAAIYGVEHVDDVRCLVLELVEGPTLADRLARGPLPVREALRIAGQIADALESAHDKGIVHRDLKPANVKLTAQGTVKVLDFGLAKAFASAEAMPPGPSASTEPRGHTAAGLVVGTAAYMSPEQAEGKPVDKRTDVWSFAVVLYEMLTGRRLFDGKSDAHVLVHVMEQEPDWSKLPTLPSGVRALMERCLQKDPAQRLRDIGDVRLLLQASLMQPPRALDGSAREAGAERRWLWPAAAAAVVIGGLAVGAAYWPRSPTAVATGPMRFDIPSEQDVPGWFLLVSPDGRRIAYPAVRQGGGQREIWVRSLETQEARPIEATAGATGWPLWSADSRYLVFSVGNQLRRVDVSGGPAQLLGEIAAMALGGFTTEDGRLVFAQLGRGLVEMPFSGGTATPAGPAAALRPSPLPDGSIVYCECLQAEAPGIYLAASGESPRQILPDASAVQYAPSPDPNRGYLLFVRHAAVPSDPGAPPGTLMAQAIDPRRLRLLGDPVAIADDVSAFSASNNGVLVYSQNAVAVPTTAPGVVRGVLTWFDREGHVASTVGEPGVYRSLALSPDQKSLAVERGDPRRDIDIYLFEFARGVPNRFTFDAANDFQPVWWPDGSSVIFTRFERGTGAWYRRVANLAGEEELLFRARDQGTVSSVSPDGRFLLFTGPLPATGDIQAVDLNRVPEAREAIPVVDTEFYEVNARFSPDGRWFAYASNESGRFEIYVRPFNPDAPPGVSPGAGGRVMVSTSGATGAGAIWRADGQELFYVATDGTMMAVPVSTKLTFSVNGPAKALFKLPGATVFFDVSSDGQRFLVPIAENSTASAQRFRVVLNWTATLD